MVRQLDVSLAATGSTSVKCWFGGSIPQPGWELHLSCCMVMTRNCSSPGSNECTTAPGFALTQAWICLDAGQVQRPVCATSTG